MKTDLTFITNEESKNLLERFGVLVRDTRFFDALVGYFYTSGFYALYKSLEKTEKIRILIGINTDRRAYELIKESRNPEQTTLQFSHAEVKQEYEASVVEEMEQSEDSRNVEEGVSKFIEWLKSGKLEIKAYPTQNIHAKLYIMTFAEGDRDIGRVITGSSNFTRSGLIENLEFNVELKDPADYVFAKRKFEELWKDSVDVSEKYVQTIEDKTWLNQNITPYQLYLKFLYEYFNDDLGQAETARHKYVPQDFMELVYQDQAVINAKKILENYGGVFISDVVGTGKTYIAAMLAGELDGRTLVVAPPLLLRESNPGSWRNIFFEFGVRQTKFRSIGKLEEMLEEDLSQYTNVIIDEAHRFRTETNITYETLAQICRGKRVILVTATPYNNSPKDILSQIKLFQKAKKSTIPNIPDLEGFFNGLEKKLKNLDRQRDYTQYIETVKRNAKEIREKVLKHLMVRRTRTEIAKYFGEDLKKQGFKFPDVEKPEPLFYELNDEEDAVFNETIELVASKFKYARYTPMLYYKGTVDQLEKQSQRNMGKFMRILLVKRLESSFFAFKNSIDRFIYSYEMFIKEFERGNIYVSKEYTNKIFELLENDDDEAIQRFIDEGKAEKYDSKEFKSTFIRDLRSDLDILKQVKALWQRVNRDPKLLTFLDGLSKKRVLKQNKLIIFTESKETAEYIAKNIGRKLSEATLCYTGKSTEATRDIVIENFDAKARHPKDDYRILVSTEILSEGVNLHRSNVVVNYDIPWNPTRMMQRVGRINRVDTTFDKIYTFNFFPTRQSNDQIKLKEVAIAKISAFLTLLGGDAALLTEGEPIGSHELFDRLLSKKTVTGEDGTEESELKYLQVIKNIRDKQPDLFERIKRLPRKARTAKRRDDSKKSLLTYFRRGKLQKFFVAKSTKDSQELDFLAAAKLLESNPDEKKQKLPGEYYELLEKNKEAFIFATTEEMTEPQQRRGRDSAFNLLKILKATIKNTQQLTEEQEQYLKRVMTQLEEGGLPKQTARETLKALNRLKHDVKKPLKVLATLQTHLPLRLLEAHYAEQIPTVLGKREVILSLYITRE